MKRHRVLKLVAKLLANTMIGITALFYPLIWRFTERATRDMYKQVLKICS